MNKKENLFKDDKYTSEADGLDQATDNAIREIFNTWANNYSIRDIEYVMQKTITDIALEKLLNYDTKTKKISKFIIKIDKSSIKKNPNHENMSYTVPGKIEILPDGSTHRYSQRIYTLTPAPRYIYEYLTTEVQCEYCKAKFSYKDLKADYVYCDDNQDEIWSNQICPTCGAFDCCEIEYERIDKAKPKK